MKFEELGLTNPILKTLTNEGYITPTPIQEKSIPVILKGKDVLGIARTGTGKTAAFSLPLVQMLNDNYDSEAPKKIKVLIITPTRELAMQIRNNIRTYCLGTKLKCSVVFGGINQKSQKEVLKNGVDILVATPGRLLDLIDQKVAKVDAVKYLVLDEADTMLDMGFIHDIKRIISKLPKSKQTLLYSATMPKSIEDLSSEFLKKPEIIKVDQTSTTSLDVTQKVYYVDRSNKTKLLLDLLKGDIKSALVFTRTKSRANKLAEELIKNKQNISVIHGNKSQNARMKALDNFKTGKTKILIATDIAARGIDINDLSHVINYDVPDQAENYVHRIGRTARNGKNGTSITFCSMEEKKDFNAIEKLINLEIKEVNSKYKIETRKVTNNKGNKETRKVVNNKNNKVIKKISSNKITGNKQGSKYHGKKRK